MNENYGGFEPDSPEEEQKPINAKPVITEIIDIIADIINPEPINSETINPEPINSEPINYEQLDKKDATAPIIPVGNVQAQSRKDTLSSSPGDSIKTTCEKDDNKKLCCTKGNIIIDTIQLFPADIIDKEIQQVANLIHNNMCDHIIGDVKHDDQNFIIDIVNEVTKLLDLKDNKTAILDIISDYDKPTAINKINSKSKCPEKIQVGGGNKVDKEFNDECVARNTEKIEEYQQKMLEYVLKQIYKEFDKRYFLNFIRKIKRQFEVLRGTKDPEYFIFNGSNGDKYNDILTNYYKFLVEDYDYSRKNNTSGESIVERISDAKKKKFNSKSLIKILNKSLSYFSFDTSSIKIKSYKDITCTDENLLLEEIKTKYLGYISIYESSIKDIIHIVVTSIIGIKNNRNTNERIKSKYYPNGVVLSVKGKLTRIVESLINNVFINRMTGGSGDITRITGGFSAAALGDIAGATATGLGSFTNATVGALGDVTNATVGTIGDVTKTAVGTAADIAKTTVGTAADVTNATLGTAADIATTTMGTAADVTKTAADTAVNVADSASGAAVDITKTAAGTLGNLAGVANAASNVENITDVASTVDNMKSLAEVPGIENIADVATAVPDMGSLANTVTKIPGMEESAGMLGEIPGMKGGPGMPGGVSPAQIGAALDGVSSLMKMLAGDNNKFNIEIVKENLRKQVKSMYGKKIDQTKININNIMANGWNSEYKEIQDTILKEVIRIINNNKITFLEEIINALLEDSLKNKDGIMNRIKTVYDESEKAYNTLKLNEYYYIEYTDDEHPLSYGDFLRYRGIVDKKVSFHKINENEDENKNYVTFNGFHSDEFKVLDIFKKDSSFKIKYEQNNDDYATDDLVEIVFKVFNVDTFQLEDLVFYGIVDNFIRDDNIIINLHITDLNDLTKLRGGKINITNIVGTKRIVHLLTHVNKYKGKNINSKDFDDKYYQYRYNLKRLPENVSIKKIFSYYNYYKHFLDKTMVFKGFKTFNYIQNEEEIGEEECEDEEIEQKITMGVKATDDKDMELTEDEKEHDRILREIIYYNGFIEKHADVNNEATRNDLMKIDIDSFIKKSGDFYTKVLLTNNMGIVKYLIFEIDGKTIYLNVDHFYFHKNKPKKYQLYTLFHSESTNIKVPPQQGGKNKKNITRRKKRRIKNKKTRHQR